MIARFHDMRRHEEGQAMILAAICMFILTLCVLATVNLTYATDQKIRLQNAADAAAYTTAAYEARVLNFLAYSNRAMIVDYVAEMNLIALTSYFTFNLEFIVMTEYLLQQIPIIGWVFAVILGIVSVLYGVITLTTFFTTAAGIPVLDYANYGLCMAQYAVIHSLSDSSVTGSPLVRDGPLAEVQNADPKHPGIYTVTNLSQSLLGIDETQRWFSSSGTPSTGSMVQIDPWHPENIAVTAGQAAYDRLTMVELVNAARTPWTAYGTGGFTLGVPRQATLLNINASFGFGSLGVYIGKSARTEWGALTPTAHTTALGTLCTFIGGSLGLNPCSATEQLYSLDRFVIQLSFSINVIFTTINITGGIGLDSFAYADRATWADAATSLAYDLLQLLGLSTGQAEQKVSHWAGLTSNGPSSGNSIADALVKPIRTFLQNGVKAANSYMAGSTFSFLLPPSWVPLFHLGMVPYARYRPIPQPGGISTSVVPSAPQLFNQPPVLMMVTVPAVSLNAMGQPFIGHENQWGFRIGGLTSGGAPPDSNYNRQASKEGYVNSLTFNPGATSDLGLPMPASMNGGGMAAISAAMAYYHRPGDWREPPNLFNPEWGAKLMPINDYPTLSTTGGALLPLLQQNILVH